MNCWQAVLLVTHREVMDRLDSFSYRASTLLLVLLALGAVLAAALLPRLFDAGERLRLGIVQPAALPGISQELDAAATELGLDLRLVHFAEGAAAVEALRDDRIDAVLEGDRLLYRAEEEVRLTAAVNRALWRARLPSLLEELGLTREQAGPLLDPARAEVERLEDGKADADRYRSTLSTAASIGLYIALALYGTWILQGVVEEKMSRVAEVLLGLLRPQQLLAGKALGIVLVAMLQLACTIAGGATGVLIAGGVDLPSFPPDLVLAIAAYLLLGLALYSMLFAAVGATVRRQTEAQSAALPVTFFLLIPYLLSLTYVPGHPDSPLSVLLSLLPLSSPLVMPGRIAAGEPGAVQVALSLALLLPSIAFVVWLGGRIYAGAMLSATQGNLVTALRAALSRQNGG